jgi:hypothetical protein
MLTEPFKPGVDAAGSIGDSGEDTTRLPCVIAAAKRKAIKRRSRKAAKAPKPC